MPLIRDIIDFMFPRYCMVCDKRLALSEQHVCTSCLAKLPRTYYHKQTQGRFERLFWQTAKIERANATFFYNTDIQNIIHTFKYRQKPYVAEWIASVAAQEIMDDGFFNEIDAIVPVPLHWRKKLSRGYNQCTYIAKGISKVTGIPILNDAVKRKKNNKSQTGFNHEERKHNVEDIFCVANTNKIFGKHILIVDDVITTGSTVSSMVKSIFENIEKTSKQSQQNNKDTKPDIRVSIFSLAHATSLSIPVSGTFEVSSEPFGVPIVK